MIQHTHICVGSHWFPALPSMNIFQFHLSKEPMDSMKQGTTGSNMVWSEKFIGTTRKTLIYIYIYIQQG